MERTRLLTALALALAAPSSIAQLLVAERVAQGLSTPTALAAPPADASRVFVATSAGRVRVIRDGALAPQPFLDLSSSIDPSTEGLLGLAFHPDYAANGRFYVSLLDSDQRSLVLELRVSSDPDVADPTSARRVLGPFPQPTESHNWSCLAFGPDGMLYVGSGDGGPSYDPNGRAQDLGTLLGKLLRLDVDAPPPHVPPDNPFVGLPGARPEIWAYGLRQPWRFSFDRSTGDLYLADVGEWDREEIDFAPASSAGGENYGWRCMEGQLCTQLPGCACAAPDFQEPLFQYPHSGGRCAVIGGSVYRGTTLPAMHGRYVFADHCTGQVWSFRFANGAANGLKEHTAELAPHDGSTIDRVNAIGEDAEGELYLLDQVGGELFRIVPNPCPPSRHCQSTPNSTGRSARIDCRGSTSVAVDDFTLTAGGAVPGEIGLFLMGSQSIEQPFGDGFRCVGGEVRRLTPELVCDGRGSVERAVPLAAPAPNAPPILPGDTRHFQLHYRDPAGPGGSGFNLSDGLTVSFCP